MVSGGSEATSATGEIYYLPGMGGRLDAGLGEELLRRGFALSGRETIGAFKKLRFGEQVDAVKQDLVEGFWKPEARNGPVAFSYHPKCSAKPPSAGKRRDCSSTARTTTALKILHSFANSYLFSP